MRTLKNPKSKPTVKKAKVTPVKKQAGGLYTSPSNHPRNFRPRYYMVQDTSKAVTSYNRLDYMSYARQLFSSLPDLGGALLQKASWVVGPGAFTPVYTGANPIWGDQAEEWLVKQFLPICSVNGPNYPFQTMLQLSSLSIDIDGDSALYLTTSKGGFPQVGLIASHRIGQREPSEIVYGGKFDGYKIVDGVISNDAGFPIAYRVLGDKKEDDQDIAAQNIQLLYEPEWGDQIRGISRIARSCTDWAHQEEINEFLLRGVKLGSSIGIIHKTESGDGQSSGFLAGQEEDPLAPGQSAVQVSAINGGEIYFMKSAANESIEALKDERPSQNTEAFISRIQKRALFSIGWPQEMLDASRIGGAAVRLVQDLVRRSVANRQTTLERRAKLIVNYAVAKAMKEGYLPKNDVDWYNWSFSKGAQISVDQGNENKADVENYRMGITSLNEITNKRGLDYYEVRQQNQKEVEDLVDRAQAISKSRSISFETALTLLQAMTPNSSPTAMPTLQQDQNNLGT
jgi:hypothetical protein